LTDDIFKNMHECICTFAPSTLEDEETLSDNIALYLKKANISILLSLSVMGQPLMPRSAFRACGRCCPPVALFYFSFGEQCLQFSDAVGWAAGRASGL